MAAQKRSLDCLGETVEQLAAKRICLTPHIPVLLDTFSSAALTPTCSGSLDPWTLQPLLTLAYADLKHLIDHKQSSTDWDHNAINNYDTQVFAHSFILAACTNSGVPFHVSALRPPQRPLFHELSRFVTELNARGVECELAGAPPEVLPELVAALQVAWYAYEHCGESCRSLGFICDGDEAEIDAASEASSPAFESSDADDDAASQESTPPHSEERDASAGNGAGDGGASDGGNETARREHSAEGGAHLLPREETAGHTDLAERLDGNNAPRPYHVAKGAHSAGCLAAVLRSSSSLCWQADNCNDDAAQEGEEGQPEVVSRWYPQHSHSFCAPPCAV